LSLITAALGAARALALAETTDHPTKPADAAHASRAEIPRGDH
jgi:hypothetical protein